MRQPDPTAQAELHPNAPEPGAEAGEVQLDPELLALAAPPQAQRLAALTVMAAAVVAMLALMLSLRGEMAYSLAERAPVSLGHLDKLETIQLPANAYVSVAGLPTIARAVRFRRGLSSAAYLVLPFAGKSGVFLQVPEDGGEGFVRAEYTGRLTTFGSLGRRYDQLAHVMREEAGLHVSDESLVLLAGEQPADYTWTWLVGLICVLFTALDVFLIVRWFKPLRWASET